MSIYDRSVVLILAVSTTALAWLGIARAMHPAPAHFGREISIWATVADEPRYPPEFDDLTEFETAPAAADFPPFQLCSATVESEVTPEPSPIRGAAKYPPDNPAAPAPSAPAGGPPVAPSIKIVAPREIDLGKMVHVRIERGGGPIREFEVQFEPEIAPEDLIETDSPTAYHFTAAPGVYTIRVLAIGAAAGYSRQEARLVIRDPRPAPAAAAPAKVNALDMYRAFAQRVRSTDRESQAISIANAGHIIAGKIRSRQISAGAAVEKWEEEAYLSIGSDLKAWTSPPEGRSFFAYVADILSDAAALPDYDAAAVVENLCLILQGK